VDEPIATIAPEVYGHFTEHLGSVIYDGIYVGENSKIANQHGLRSALIEKMRAIKAPMVRWPGGCFADSYDWRDGIGPRDKRPRRTNFWTDQFPASQQKRKIPQVFETNEFGTADFARFCQLAGAEPYIAANVRGLTALDFDHWVEYCNSPQGTTTLAETREADGSADPFNVLFWGVGNESWGCGGTFDPEDYATEFKRYTTWVPTYGAPLRFVASGPNSDEQAWTRGFFNKLYHGEPSTDPHGVWGLSVHHYAWNLSRGKTTDWVAGKGDALQFDSVDWYELCNETARIENIILDRARPVRPWPQGQAGGRRIWPLVPAWHRECAGTIAGPANHRPRRRDDRPLAGHLQPSRRQGGHGRLRAIGQLPQLSLPDSRRQVCHHAGLQRLRDVRGAPGRNGPAH
jgi:alpha-N-arabinofuranosidase